MWINDAVPCPLKVHFIQRSGCPFRVDGPQFLVYPFLVLEYRGVYPGGFLHFLAVLAAKFGVTVWVDFSLLVDHHLVMTAQPRIVHHNAHTLGHGSDVLCIPVLP